MLSRVIFFKKMPPSAAFRGPHEFGNCSKDVPRFDERKDRAVEKLRCPEWAEFAGLEPSLRQLKQLPLNML